MRQHRDGRDRRTVLRDPPPHRCHPGLGALPVEREAALLHGGQLTAQSRQRRSLVDAAGPEQEPELFVPIPLTSANQLAVAAD